MKLSYGIWFAAIAILIGSRIISSELLVFYGEVAFWTTIIMGFMPEPIVKFFFSGEHDAS